VMPPQKMPTETKMASRCHRQRLHHVLGGAFASSSISESDSCGKAGLDQRCQGLLADVSISMGWRPSSSSISKSDSYGKARVLVKGLSLRSYEYGAAPDRAASSSSSMSESDGRAQGRENFQPQGCMKFGGRIRFHHVLSGASSRCPWPSSTSGSRV